MKHIDIEELHRKGIDMATRDLPKPTTDDCRKYKSMIQDILQAPNALKEKDMANLCRVHKFTGKRSFLFHIYQDLIRAEEISASPEQEDILRKSLMIKACKSWSGITSITVFTTAYPEYTDGQGTRVRQEFSCAYNCSFCPKQEGQPRSYILNEPGVLRANRNEFDCVRQIHDRMQGLYMIGHPDLGKLEILVLGGTFASYPREYREEFARDIYYAANTFWGPSSTGTSTSTSTDTRHRPRLSLDEEKHINRTTKSRVIGLTFETRGDTITPEELRFYRKLGCTRLQMGIQHIDDEVLDKNNRRCPHRKTVAAIRLLKENCWKIDGHFMPNLPFTTIEKDRNMLIDNLLGLKNQIVPRRWDDRSGAHWERYDLVNPDIQVDQMKIYPTTVTVYTEIEEWYKSGRYKPYDESLFLDLMLDFKSMVFPWIRINRIVRDFFADAIFSESGSNLGLRSDLSVIMRKMGTWCSCIRCREVKSQTWDGRFAIYVRQYNASEGTEYFISAESPEPPHHPYPVNTLYGFVRMRLDHARNKVFPELNGAALVREVHVYSQLTNVGIAGKHLQHRGIGRALMNKAEEIAKQEKYSKVAVIAGVGAQTFYEKIGYSLEVGGGSLDTYDGEFMMKFL